MSISVELFIYDWRELWTALESWGADNIDTALSVLKACGTFTGNQHYVLLHNEYYGESPYYAVITLMDSAFNKDDSYTVFSSLRKKGINYVEAGAVASELGITLRDD